MWQGEIRHITGAHPSRQLDAVLRSVSEVDGTRRLYFDIIPDEGPVSRFDRSG